MQEPNPVTVAVITGGGQGLGAATARRFAELGWTVVVLERDLESGSRLAGELGARVSAIACDVSQTAEVDAAFGQIEEDYGQVDCLVNNAGFVRPGASQDLEDEAWLAMLDVHLGGTIRASRAAFPLLARQPNPTIVNLSSICAARGFPGRLSYNAAKAAIESVTRTLAVEWASARVRVNAVAPGFILTENSRRLYDRGVADMQSRVAATPLGRMGDPSEVAEAIVWLASPASSFVTGQVLAVDGGFLADSGERG